MTVIGHGTTSGIAGLRYPHQRASLHSYPHYQGCQRDDFIRQRYVLTSVFCISGFGFSM